MLKDKGQGFVTLKGSPLKSSLCYLSCCLSQGLMLVPCVLCVQCVHSHRTYDHHLKMLVTSFKQVNILLFCILKINVCTYIRYEFVHSYSFLLSCSSAAWALDLALASASSILPPRLLASQPKGLCPRCPGFAS